MLSWPHPKRQPRTDLSRGPWSIDFHPALKIALSRKYRAFDLADLAPLRLWTYQAWVLGTRTGSNKASSGPIDLAEERVAMVMISRLARRNCLALPQSDGWQLAPCSTPPHAILQKLFTQYRIDG